MIVVKVPNVRKAAGDRPNTAPAKIESPSKSKDADPPAKAKRPTTTATKKPAAKKPSASSMTNLGTLEMIIWKNDPLYIIFCC